MKERMQKTSVQANDCPQRYMMEFEWYGECRLSCARMYGPLLQKCIALLGIKYEYKGEEVNAETIAPENLEHQFIYFSN